MEKNRYDKDVVDEDSLRGANVVSLWLKNYEGVNQFCAGAYCLRRAPSCKNFDYKQTLSLAKPHAIEAEELLPPVELVHRLCGRGASGGVGGSTGATGAAKSEVPLSLVVSILQRHVRSCEGAPLPPRACRRIHRVCRRIHRACRRIHRACRRIHRA